MNHITKTMISVAVLTAFIIGISIFAQKILFKTSNELSSDISKIESSTSSNNWKAAEGSLHKIEKKWTDIKSTWAILIDHQEIDNIDVTLSRMEKYVQAKDSSSALAEASALMKFIKHIPDKEILSIRNVF